jgi:hypothetical protein
VICQRPGDLLTELELGLDPLLKGIRSGYAALGSLLIGATIWLLALPLLCALLTAYRSQAAPGCSLCSRGAICVSSGTQSK